MSSRFREREYAAFNRVRYLFRKKDGKPDYEPVNTNYEGIFNEEEVRRPILVVPEDSHSSEQPFSWLEYSIFLLLGIAMLWAWNMFLAAAPYFQSRFYSNKAILSRFQPAITSISCIMGLVSTIILTQLQSKANYPRRIIIGLSIDLVIFGLLTVSTSYFREVSTELYFTFTLITVFCTAGATGLFQNGAFAFASSFGRPEYIQAIMTGQGVAGVLPAIAQILSVLAVSEPKEPMSTEKKAIIMEKEKSAAAFTYFVTATVVAIITLLAVIPLVRKHNRILRQEIINSYTSTEEIEIIDRKVVGMWTLFKKLYWLAASVFLCLAITMFFPVFTEKITSVVPEDKAIRLLRPDAFIPLGFLIWNIGDLLGRLSTLGPLGKIYVSPLALFIFACLRAGFIPLYFLCNFGGHGALINSDAFYLVFVSGGFGATNGWLCSKCLMSAGSYVEEGEREASGGFMIVNLLAGLTVGSLLSFVISEVKT